MAFGSQYIVVKWRNGKNVFCETLQETRIVLSFSGGEIIANYNPKTKELIK